MRSEAEVRARLEGILSPAWLLDCVMFDKKHNSLVISPHYLREHGIAAIDITDNKFGSFTRVHIRIKENPRKLGSGGAERSVCLGQQAKEVPERSGGREG